jgi:hypothetical protein
LDADIATKIKFLHVVGEPTPLVLTPQATKQKFTFGDIASPWDVQLLVHLLGYHLGPAKINSLSVFVPTDPKSKIATMNYEPATRHWSVTANNRNAKFISNLTASHEAFQTSLGVTSHSGGTTVIASPMMPSYQQFTEFASKILTTACPGMTILDQAATGKNVHNTGFRVQWGNNEVNITANHGANAAPTFKIDGKAPLRMHVVATCINMLRVLAASAPSLSSLSSLPVHLNEMGATPTFVQTHPLPPVAPPHR